MFGRQASPKCNISICYEILSSINVFTYCNITLILFIFPLQVHFQTANLLETVSVKYLKSFFKKKQTCAQNLCRCHLVFPTGRRAFGSAPSSHLTLDKSAGRAPRAVKVIYCWLCSQCQQKCPVAHHTSLGLYVV